MSKKLTRELIALKVKSDRLESIRKLNLWGSNLEDISIISEMPSLEIVSLSVNKIRTLKPFANLQNLKELYLRKNMISNLNEIKHLTDCENLNKLWLKENPICDNPNYREVIICVLPQVQNLDDIEITEEERARAEKKLSGNYDEEEDNEQENKIEQNEREEEKYSPKKNFSNEKNRGGVNQGGEKNFDKEDEDKFYENYENFQNKNKLNKGMKNKINKYDEEENNDYIPNNKLYQQKGNYRHNYYENYDERPIGGAGKMAKNNNYRKAVTNDDIKYENRYKNKYENKYEDDYKENKPKEKKKGNSNVLNVVINLLKELSTNELQIVKREIDRINGY